MHFAAAQVHSQQGCGHWWFEMCVFLSIQLNRPEDFGRGYATAWPSHFKVFRPRGHTFTPFAEMGGWFGGLVNHNHKLILA